MHRIYTNVLQTATPTGRLACEDPNLMSITHEITFIPYWDLDNPNPDTITISSIFFLEFSHFNLLIINNYHFFLFIIIFFFYK